MSDQPTTPFAKAKVKTSGYSAALDAAIWGEMPKYEDDPWAYKQRLRARFANSEVVKRAGLRTKDLNTNVLINEVVDVLKRGNDFGNERYAWRLFHQRVHKYMKLKANAAANKPETVLRTYGKDLNLSAECIEQIMRTPSGKGGLGSNLEFYEAKMRQAAGVGFYETGVETNIAAATAIANEYDAMLRAKGADVEADKPVETAKEETVAGQNELIVPIWSAVDKPEGQQQIPAFQHFNRELRIIDPAANVTASILKALGEPLGSHIETHGIALTCEKLQGHLNSYITQEDAPESPDLEAGAMGIPDATSKIDSAKNSTVKPMSQKGIVDMPESPIVVYPMQNGSIVYKGIRFSVTLRLGGTFDMALVLMNEFAGHIELVDRTCLVQAPPPTNVTSLPQPETPPQATAQLGNKPIMSEPILKIEREFDKDKKFKYTGLYTNFGNAPGKYATYKVKDGTPLSAKINAISGIDWAAADLGVETPGQMTAFYTDSDKMNASGKPYHDLVDLQAIAQQNAA